MPVHRVSQPMLAFRWNRRKEVCTWIVPPGTTGYPTPTTTRIVENVRKVQDTEQLTDTFRELSTRQYEAFKQLLIEAKFKSEAMLRDDAVASDPGRLAYYAGWISYADYVLASFETYREATSPIEE